MRLSVHDTKRIDRYNQVLKAITRPMAMPAIIRLMPYATNTTRIDVINLAQLGYMDISLGDKPKAGQTPRLYMPNKLEFNLKDYTPFDRIVSAKGFPTYLDAHRGEVVIEHESPIKRTIRLTDTWLSKPIKVKVSAWQGYGSL
jgi:hypothetical protein